jgi:endonuclease/exonuclease/phosphatase family metal-dependent hydrolase
MPRDGGGRRVRFLSYNILDGGRGREAELEEILAAQDADVVLLQEVAGQEFVRRLAARQDYSFFVGESNSRRTIALLTRLRIVEASSFRPPILRHTCLHATLEYAPNAALVLLGVHLAAPAFTLPVEFYRLLELNAIFGRLSAGGAQRTLVAGDMNSLAPGDTPDFRSLPLRVRLGIFLRGGHAARQVIGRMRAKGFVDAYRTLNPTVPGYTFPAGMPKARLDYFFVSADLAPALRECAVVMTPAGVRRASDHLPLRMELEL